MFETAHTDYAANYERPIIVDIFSENFLITPKNSNLSIDRAKLVVNLSRIKLDLFSKNLLFLNGDTQYRPCRLFLPIPIITDCFNNRPDYANGRCIGTALNLICRRMFTK